MKNETEKTCKKAFRPVEIQVFNYNVNDLLSASNGYDPFLGEDDQLSNHKAADADEQDV